MLRLTSHRFAFFHFLIAVTFGVVALACGRSQHQATTAAPTQLESFVFTSEDGASTRFWLADPAKPSVRRLLQTVDHQLNWSGVAAVSPDGRSIAYTVLPPGERDPDRGAQLLVLDIAAKRSYSLASGVDLRSSLIWSLSSEAITYQRFVDGQQQLWIQPKGGGPGRLLAEGRDGHRLLPIGFSGESLLAARFSSGGTVIERLNDDRPPESLQTLAHQMSRGFTLSHNGDRLAFLTVSGDGPDAVSHAEILDLHVASMRQLPGDWGEIAGVSWSANDLLVAGSTGPAAALRNELGERISVPLNKGFAQPLLSSPSGRYLALRAFSGDSGAQPGSARDLLLSQRGRLIAIADSQPVRFVGWVSEAP
jgi:hypothetical protein